jgi:hypothetical protein
VEKIAGQAGLVLLGLIVAGLIASRFLRRFAARAPGLEAIGDRLAATAPLAWARRRFPAQVAWGRRRLDPRSPRGFWLTFTVAAGALAAWAFGGLTQDVIRHDDTALADPHVTAWVITHRTGWLTSTLSVLTWLGSTAVIIPAGLAIGLYFRGGTGSCLIDDYVTRIGAHHYQEIACLVQGRTSASVIVAAAPAAMWAQARPLLLRAVAAYLIR